MARSKSKQRGVQPAKEELRRRGITQDSVAKIVGLSLARVTGSLNGWQRAHPRVVEACERLTGLPRERLFTPQATHDFRLPFPEEAYR